MNRHISFEKEEGKESPCQILKHTTEVITNKQQQTNI